MDCKIFLLMLSTGKVSFPEYFFLDFPVSPIYGEIMTLHRDRNPALRAAIKSVNGVGRLAEHLGVTSQAISQWSRIPVAHVLRIEKLTGVSRYRQRPDIYGRTPKKTALDSHQAA